VFARLANTLVEPKRPWMSIALFNHVDGSTTSSTALYVCPGQRRAWNCWRRMASGVDAPGSIGNPSGVRAESPGTLLMRAASMP
jgi:hypothetical protein